MPGQRTSGARGLRRLLTVLIVLVLLLLGLDRGGVLVAERIAGDNLRTSQGLSSRPEVDIAGLPFLTQLAGGHYDRITVTAADVPVSRTPNALRLSRLQVVLHDLQVSRNFGRFHAATAVASATIGYDRLSALIGATVTYAGDGRVRATKSFTVLGNTVNPTVTVAPTVVDGALSFGGATINGLADVSEQLTAAAGALFDLRAPLNGIPFQIRVRSLRADPVGLQIALAGSDLTYVDTTA